MKNFLLAFALLAPFLADAQALSGIGASGGASFTNFEDLEEYASSDAENKDKLGGTAGIRLDFGNGPIKLSPEFFFIQNGAKEYTKSSGAFLKNGISLNYGGMYLPLTIYINMGGDGENFNGIMLQGKGFADYAFGGTVNDKNGKSGTVRFQQNKDRIDWGWGLEGGFIIKGVSLMLGYNYGLKNIEFSTDLQSGSGDDYLINNRGFTISVGYLANLNGDE